MRAGELDRRITIESVTETQSASGAPIEAWSAFAVVSANVSATRGREFFAARQVVAERAASFRIRWLEGLTAKMRIRYDGDTYDIHEIRELGRREGLEVLAAAKGV